MDFALWSDQFPRWPGVTADNQSCPSQKEKMKDQAKTKHQLIDEILQLRLRADQLEGLAKDQREIASRLEQSERLFRGLTNNGLDSIAVLDREGQIFYASPSIERIWNRRAAEASEWDKFSLVHRSEHTRVARGWVRVLRQPGVPMRAEYRVLHGDGSWRTVETVTTNLLLDPSIMGVVVSFRDITQRKRAEGQLRRSEAELRLLSQEILEVAEKERARVARDLHDLIGSELAFFQVKASVLATHIKGNQAAEQEMTELLTLSERIQADCHRIVMTLGSTMIDDLGLMRSVEWYVEEFERRTGIPCAVDTPIGDIEMDKAIAMAAYRIVQEALTNVWKHANASEAQVEVSTVGNSLKLRISDDGVGFDIEDRARGRSVGLLSMIERAHLVGGKVRISSKAGRGTQVAARLPLDGRSSHKGATAQRRMHD